VNLKRPELLVIALFAAFVACSGRSSSSSSGGGGSSATLVSISLSPSAPSIQTGGTQQFTATGAFSDNTTQNLTSTATWSSSNPSVATITSAGVASGVAVGTTTIKAASGTISGTTTLTVSATAPPPPTTTDVLTYHNDLARTGQNLRETLLTPANVDASNFGKLFVISVDGKVDAQPLYVSSVAIAGGTHNVLVVATEHDSVYAFDADTGAKLWQVSMLKTGETTSEDRFSCGQVTPEIGVTATPVIDRNAGPNGTVYVVAMSKNSAPTYFQRLHALNLATGAEEFGGPQDVHATFPGTGANSNGGLVLFDPGAYKERPGLLLLNGIVYTSWSSHCDIGPYTGWIIGYDQNTLSQATVINIVPNGSEASFWNSGAAPAADADGNIYQLAANGTFDSTLNANGFPSQNDFGNAFIRFSTVNNKLAVADFFALFNTASESSSDTDLGSGGAMLLPDLTDGSGVVRHLALGAGKDGNIYVTDRDNMGKFNPSTNNIYQQLTSAIGAEFGAPAFFNNTVFFGGVSDRLKAFSITNAKLSTSPTSQTGTTFSFPGTTPSISANGNANGIVWAAENGSTAVLHAYDAANLATELYNSNQAANSRDHFGTGNKFIVPTIANGKVYVGTTDGVGVFGLLH
jgi:Big-like domain-containing protein/putative pyrroloquinoline-quinone binding quinoprotein